MFSHKPKTGLDNEIKTVSILNCWLLLNNFGVIFDEDLSFNLYKVYRIHFCKVA